MNNHDDYLQIGQFKVSHELFDKGYPLGSGPCSCTSVCCAGGVYADVKEKENILAHKELVKRYMDDTQTTDDTAWFEQKDFDDPDFASGRCVGTQELNDKCVFLDRAGRCSLQVAASAEGMHKWALKPLFCILYPIEISNKVIGVDDMLQDEQPCCSVRTDFQMPMFEACKEELVHLIGEDGFVLMQKHFSSLRRVAMIDVPTKG